MMMMLKRVVENSHPLNVFFHDGDDAIEKRDATEEG